MRLYNEAPLVAVLADGRLIDVTIKNFGWNAARESYVTRFEFDGTEITVHFQTAYHEPQFCSEPDVRFNHDYERLEAAIEKRFGFALENLEVD